MTDKGETKSCPRCSGRGKYADPSSDPLVQITCERCDGSGSVPADSPDEPPAQEPKQVPFFGARGD
jgi:DnaJ-class molecular chaperone